MTSRVVDRQHERCVDRPLVAIAPVVGQVDGWGHRFFDTVVELLGEPAGEGISPEQGVRLSDAREAVLEMLERQEERLMAGTDPVVLPFGAIDEASINRRVTESQARLQAQGHKPG